MRARFELTAVQYNNMAAEQSGALAEALARESEEDLKKAYYSCRTSGDFANRLFGHAAVAWERKIAGELHRRGVTSFVVKDCLGSRTIEVRN